MPKEETGRFDRRNVNEELNRGSDTVAQMIGGLSLGGGLGTVVTGGGGLLPGAVIGAIIGVLAPNVLTALARRSSRTAPKK